MAKDTYMLYLKDCPLRRSGKESKCLKSLTLFFARLANATAENKKSTNLTVAHKSAFKKSYNISNFLKMNVIPTFTNKYILLYR